MRNPTNAGEQSTLASTTQALLSEKVRTPSGAHRCRNRSRLSRAAGVIHSDTRIHDNAEAVQLLAAARDGGEREFTAFATHYHALMMKAARGIAWNPCDAEEAVNDALVSIWRELRALDLAAMSNPVAWICVYTQNAARNILARGRAKMRGGPNPSIHEDELVAHYHGLHRRRKNGTVTEEHARTPDYDPLRRLGLVYKLMGQVPSEYVSLLDTVYCKGFNVEGLARDRGMKTSDMVHKVHTGLSIFRHLAAKEADAPAEYEPELAMA